jgi:hypothetical protein
MWYSHQEGVQARVPIVPLLLRLSFILWDCLQNKFSWLIFLAKLAFILPHFAHDLYSSYTIVLHALNG